MILRQITDIIEEFAPLSLQEGFDNSGLIVGSPEKEITGALFCVDVTREVIEEACEKGLNLVISHHPPLFTPLKRITGASHAEKIVETAIVKGVAIYSCHTNLDSAEGGLSWRMAEMTGLRDISVLSPREGGKTGFGAVGKLPKPEKPENVLKMLKNVFGTEIVRYSAPHKESIEKIALCSGSGSFCLDDAIAAGADMFVTAEVKHHQFYEAKGCIIIADIGHFESEYCSIDLLYGIVTKKLPKFATCKSERSRNPVMFL